MPKLEFSSDVFQLIILPKYQEVWITGWLGGNAKEDDCGQLAGPVKDEER